MKKLNLNFESLNAEVLTRSQLKQILGGDGGSGSDPGRVACMECGGSIGTLCLAAPAGGACEYSDDYNMIYCTNNLNGGDFSNHYCSDYQN